jgi:DNA-binding IclR family transcriptional regulator
MSVKAADRTLDLFEAFAAFGRPASLSDIAGALNIPASSCFALTNTIKSRGYLYSLRDRGPLYPTGRLLQIARTIAANDPIRTRVEGALSTLRDHCGETVVIGTIRSGGVVLQEVFESPQAIRYSPKPGDLRPIHANSIGKAVLSAMSPKDRADLLARSGLDRLTPKTICSADALEADIAQSLKRGWFQNTNESVGDLIAVALPVTINGTVFGVSIAGPAHRMARSPLEVLVTRLREACNAIEDPRETRNGAQAPPARSPRRASRLSREGRSHPS